MNMFTDPRQICLKASDLSSGMQFSTSNGLSTRVMVSRSNDAVKSMSWVVCGCEVNKIRM